MPVEVRPGAIFAPFGGICSRYGTYMSLNVPLGARKCEETAPFSATALSLPRMTDHEFEKLDAEFQRRLRGRRKIPPEMTARLVSCRDCDRPDPEFYMVKRELWLQAVPSGRGCLLHRLFIETPKKTSHRRCFHRRSAAAIRRASEGTLRMAFLTRTDPAKNIDRFYFVDVTPTLFGEWAVLRE